MKSFKKLLVMMMIMTLTLALTGCGTKNNTAQNNSESTSPEVESTQENVTSEEPETTETVETTYPLTVTDSNGNEVTVDAEPEKIVSLAPGMTELIFALGAQDKLVGRTDYCDYPEQATEIESIGSIYPVDVEKVVSLEPDLVIGSTHFEEEDAAKLTDLGITNIELYDEYDMNGVYDSITTVGALLNRQAEAAQLIADMKAQIEEVSEAVEGLEAPSVYYVVGYGEYGDYTAGGDTFINGLIELAGGDNVAKDVSGWSYSLESLLEADPEIIVVRAGEKDTFMTTEGYSELTAVKEGNVYEIDNNLLDRQGYRNAEGVRTLAEIFHPEAFN